MRHTMTNIRVALKGLSWKTTHIRREGNKAVDFLANLGKESVETRRFTGSSAPAKVRALV